MPELGLPTTPNSDLFEVGSFVKRLDLRNVQRVMERFGDQRALRRHL